jgi:EAL domain-containing protein (putative c-di-GMP-specific phosphodiesterase class I)
VVEAIVRLARAFNVRTVAEGIEDDATLESVRAAGVDFGQGFYLGRPAPIGPSPGPFTDASLPSTADSVSKGLRPTGTECA